MTLPQGSPTVIATCHFAVWRHLCVSFSCRRGYPRGRPWCWLNLLFADGVYGCKWLPCRSRHTRWTCNNIRETLSTASKQEKWSIFLPICYNCANSCSGLRLGNWPQAGTLAAAVNRVIIKWNQIKKKSCNRSALIVAMATCFLFFFAKRKIS